MCEIQFDCEGILRWGWRDLQSVVFLDETEDAICFDGAEIDDGAIVVGVDDCVSLFIIWLWCEGDILHVAVGAAHNREFAEIDGVAGIGWTVQNHAPSCGAIEAADPDIRLVSCGIWYFQCAILLNDAVPCGGGRNGRVVILENDGRIGVVRHEMDESSEIVIGGMFRIPLDFVLELVAAKIFEFSDRRAGNDPVVADGGVFATGVVEFAALAASIFAVEAICFFKSQFAFWIFDKIAVLGERMAIDGPFRFAAVDPDFRAVFPCDMLAVDVVINKLMSGHVGSGVEADEVLRKPIFADGGESPTAGVCHKIVG